MPNKYSQPVQSQFVPQFQPPDMGLLQQTAQNYQKRQQQGLQQYDQLQQSLMSLDVLESDKELLDEKRKRIEEKLGHFEDENDFIDAMPAIRREARNLQKDFLEGDLGTAIQNKQRAMESFKKINESDWSPEEKEKLKELYLSGYSGAREGDTLDTFNVPEKVDIDDHISEVIANVDDTVRESIVNLKTPSGQTVQGLQKVKAKNPTQIKMAISQELKNNPKLQETLATEARLQGNETAEEVEDYINQRIDSLSVKERIKHSDVESDLSNIQWDPDDGKSTRTSSMSSVAFEQGTMATNSVLPSFEDAMDNIRSAQEKGDESKAQSLMTSVEAAASGAMGAGAIKENEWKYLKNNMDRALQLQSGTQQAFEWAGEITGLKDPRSQEEKQRDQRLNEIMGKMSEYVNGETEGNKGIATKSAIPTNEKVKEDLNYTLGKLNPGNFEYVDTEKQGLDESEKKKNIKKILKDGELESVNIISDNHKPMMKFGYQNEDDEYEEAYLTYKDSADLRDRDFTDGFDKVINTAFGADSPVAKEIIGNYTFSNIPATGENIYDKLPSTLKREMEGRDFLAMTPTKDNRVTAQIGTEDNRHTITKADMFSAYHNLLKSDEVRSNQERFENVSQNLFNMIQTSNLDSTKKEKILGELTGYMKGENQISASEFEELEEEFNRTPFEFSNQNEAFKIATGKINTDE